MIRAIAWALLGLAVAIGAGFGLGLLKVNQFKALSAPSAQPPMLPEPVTVAEAQEQMWQPRLPSVGSVVAVQGTVVSTEADGVVREIKFREGTMVAAGDVLVQLDTDIESAQLREAVAAAELAQSSYRRTRELAATKTVATQELETTEGDLKKANARVESLKALIAKKIIRAPFAGKIGIRKISVGQYLDKGSPVVSLESLDPVYVDFSLPQQHLGQVAEGLAVTVTTDAFTSQTFGGNITAINPDIDTSTRNVRVRATLANPDHRLRPGMFVSVDVVLAKKEKVIFIPATAVQHAPYGDSIFLVEEDKKPKDAATTRSLVVRQQFVRLGARHGDFVVATEGLSAGATVVSTGVFKLRSGGSVVIDNTLAPKFSLTPKPENT